MFRRSARHHEPRTARPRRRITRPVSTALITSLTLGPVLFAAPASAAPAPIASPGDIVLATNGSWLTGAGVDRLDPKTGAWSRATSFPGDDFFNDVSVAPDGSWYVYGQSLARVDPTTGARTEIVPARSLHRIMEVTAGTGDTVVVAHTLDDAYGPSAISVVNTVDGSVRDLTPGPYLGNTEYDVSLAVESDGDVLAATSFGIVRIDIRTGDQSLLLRYSTSVAVHRITLSAEGDIYLASSWSFDDSPDRISRVNPLTGDEHVIVTGPDFFLADLAVAADGSLYVAGRRRAAAAPRS